jgi:5-methylcytosine-specific restriction enzyme A
MCTIATSVFAGAAFHFATFRAPTPRVSSERFAARAGRLLRYEHYDDTKAAAGKEALYVDVRFDYLVKPGGVLPIQRSELNTPDLESTVWNAQGSGKTIPTSVSRALTEIWKNRVQVDELHLPDEVEEAEKSFAEGATRTILVNAYERKPEARRRCLNKWGYNCVVCQFRVDLHYGPLGKGYMHVHHLRPLSSIRKPMTLIQLTIYVLFARTVTQCCI